MSVCNFCKGEPVTDAASWLDGKPRPPAPCPRCGAVSYPKYRTIVADPPWPHDDGFASHFGRVGQGVHALPYKSMALRDIAAIDVGRFADPQGARLFVWATNRHLRDGLEIIGGWGFAYRQTLIWHKTGNPSPFGGSVAPNHAEFLLVAAQGAPPVLDRWASSVVAAPKPTRDHSRKPDVFGDLIETVSPGPYLELFARRQRLGWDTWGDEALEHVQLETA